MAFPRTGTAYLNCFLMDPKPHTSYQMRSLEPDLFQISISQLREQDWYGACYLRRNRRCATQELQLKTAHVHWVDGLQHFGHYSTLSSQFSRRVCLLHKIEPWQSLPTWEQPDENIPWRQQCNGRSPFLSLRQLLEIKDCNVKWIISLIVSGTRFSVPCVLSSCPSCKFLAKTLGLQSSKQPLRILGGSWTQNLPFRSPRMDPHLLGLPGPSRYGYLT